ncbi:MAG: ClpXP protease specificity-enhancing factor SspB, partial [Thiogranum sp.]
GKIVLNIGPHAVESLQITNEEVTFVARFSGVSLLISLPVSAVLAIYAKENGRGMMFNEADEPEPDDSGPRPASRPSLKVVK